MSDPLISPEHLSELIGLVYDCAIDPGRWPIAMEAIRVELACHNATLDLVELPSGTSLTSASANIPPAYLPLLAQAGSDVLEQWGGEAVVRALPIERPAVMSRVNPGFTERMDGNHYFQAFAKPQGLIDVLAVALARDARAIGALAFGRHHSAGPIGEREIAIAQLLLPHLQRAATINRLIEREASARATLVSTLDVLAVPIVLVDADRRLFHANPAAQRMLEDADLIRVSGTRLETAASSATRSLAAAVTSIARGDPGITPRGVGVPVAQAEKAGALHIIPLIGWHGASSTSQAAVAAVFVSAALAPSAAAIEMATSLFNLTRREASVFEHLAAGHSQPKTAAALGIGSSTVKTHLARIYDKLGVSSQAELIAVATSLSIPVCT